MAQNITLMGASYSGVPGVNLPKTGGGQAYFVDSSDANAVASDIATGKTAYVNGTKVTGTNSGGGGGGMTLLTTYTMGAIATSSTSSVSTGKTITFTGYNDYDVLVVVASVDTPTNDRHTSTVSMIYLTGPTGVETKTTYTMGGNKWNSKLSSIGVGTTRQSTTAYGIYAQSPSVSNNTMSIQMYQRYNSSNTGTINGNYTVRVYGLKLYELIGG